MKYVFCIVFLGSFLNLLHSQTGVLTGIVVDEELTPLPGATIRLAEWPEINTTSDIQGKFIFSKVPAGTVTLRVVYLGMAPYENTGIVITPSTANDLGRIQLKTNQELGEVVVAADISGKDVKALNITKLASRPVSVLAAEGVGKLPDRNAAEAVQRLAGVVMERDHGEGRWVSFRGTPADWSSALVNGDRMPVADEENKTRALNFDIFPASLIEYVVVSRALTPDIEGDAIGGSANFMTRSAPNRRTLNTAVSYGVNEKSGKPMVNASLLWGDRTRNGKFGYLLGGSLYRRNWATDNYQIFYGGNTDHSINRLELRAYNGLRTSLGANAAVEYVFNPKYKIYAKGLYGSMDDEEYNRKMMFAYNPGIGQSVRLQNIHNILSTRLVGGELGGQAKLGPTLTADWKIATYHNRFQYGPVPFADKNDKRNGYYVVEFEKQVYYTDFLYLDENGNQTDEANAYSRQKLLDIDSPVRGYGDHYDNIQPTFVNILPVTPTDTMFQFVKLYTETNRTRESDPVVAQLDFSWQFKTNLAFKVGGKYRAKNGERAVGLEVWERSPTYPQAIVYDSFATQTVGRTFLPEIGAPYEKTLPKYFSDQTLDNFYAENAWRLRYLPFSVNTPYYNQFIGSSYRYTEQVGAGYAMADWHGGQEWHINAGLRAEYTEPNVSADSVIEDIVNNTRFLTNRTAGKSYWAILPMLNIKYNLNERSAIRLATTRSFRRPNFNELKPGQPSIDYTNFELIRGNPELNPSYAWNIDLVYERYLPGAGLFTLSGYYKYVIDHIYTAFESANADAGGASNQFQVPGGVIAKVYQNAPKAFAAGLEAAFQGKFWFLPGFLKNFGLNANISITASEMEIKARNTPQPLPRQSKYLFNAALFFENTRFNARLALNYKAPYLMELNLYAVKDPASGEVIIVHQDNAYDVYSGATLTFDASCSWNFTPRFALFAEANNLTNTEQVIYRGRRERPVKTEYYGIRGLAGIRFNLN